MTDFWNDVRDDGSPAAALNVAEQGVRSAIHRSSTVFDPLVEGWRWVPDAYRCIGELKSMTAMMAQILTHLSSAIVTAAERGEAEVDQGVVAESRPIAGRVVAAKFELAMASYDLGLVAASLEQAQQAINAVHYSGPPIEEGEGADAPDCTGCGASNAGSRQPPHLCDVCDPSLAE